MSEYIEKEVHHLYYDYDENCARTSLKCLSHLFAFPLSYDIRVIYIKNNIDGCRVAESCPRMLVALKV